MISEFDRRWAATDKTLTYPLRWRKPAAVRLTGDLFHEDCPDEWIDKVFAVMALSPQHTFQVLTKRAERMWDYFKRPETPWSPKDDIQEQVWLKLVDRHGDIEGLYSRALDAVTPWPLPNVWLGVSAERQQEWDERSEHLRATPAVVTFVSCEPLLGPIDFHPCRHCNHPGNVVEWPCSACKGRRFEIPDWVIVGGESGAGARPMHPDWARSLRDECAAAGVSYFFKQWGEYGRVADQCPPPDHLPQDADLLTRVGKKAAGRQLDGIEHNAMPERVTA